MKNNPDYGKPPTRLLHVGKPNIGNRDRFLNRINQILDNGILTNNGPFVQKLESRIAELFGVKHCVAVCNGTVALEIAIRALGMDGEVILPSFTFVSTAHALEWQGITPVFCDIDPETHNLDPQKVEKLITERTTGIIGVHLWGRPCAPEALAEIAKRRGLTLLFDAAHAFGCSYKARMIGNFGDAEILSFHATKFFNSAEGGAIVTNNDGIAEKARQFRNMGFVDYDKVISHGINGKMNELSAALGLTNLESINDFIDINRKNYNHYTKELDGINGLSLMEYNSEEKNNFQYIVVMVDKEKTGVQRDEIISMLHNNGILARRYFWPGCHRMEPYCTQKRTGVQNLPETEKIAAKIMVLPTGSGTSSSDISYVCDLINKLCS
jgi:dTDP-4-amino-4,6-dideoxygalactose transaminase